MKKVISLISSLALVISLSSCAIKETPIINGVEYKYNDQFYADYNVPLVKTQMKKIIVTAKTLYSHPKNVSKIYAALHTDLAW